MISIRSSLNDWHTLIVLLPTLLSFVGHTFFDRYGLSCSHFGSNPLEIRFHYFAFLSISHSKRTH